MEKLQEQNEKLRQRLRSSREREQQMRNNEDKLLQEISELKKPKNCIFCKNEITDQLFLTSDTGHNSHISCMQIVTALSKKHERMEQLLSTYGKINCPICNKEVLLEEIYDHKADWFTIHKDCLKKQKEIFIVSILNSDYPPLEFYEFHKAFGNKLDAEKYLKAEYEEEPDLDKETYKIECVSLK